MTSEKTLTTAEVEATIAAAREGYYERLRGVVAAHHAVQRSSVGVPALVEERGGRRMMEKPSEVQKRMWRGMLPFIGSGFRRAEMELAAGVYVWACAALGDEWQPIRPRQMGELLKLGVCPSMEMALNQPFCRPDFHALAAQGFGAFDGDPNDPGHKAAGGTPFTLTEAGLAVIENYGKPVDALGGGT